MHTLIGVTFHRHQVDYYRKYRLLTCTSFPKALLKAFSLNSSSPTIVERVGGAEAGDSSRLVPGPMGVFRGVGNGKQLMI